MSFLNKIADSIAKISVVKLLINKSKVTTLPGFSGIPIYDVIRFFIGQVQKEDMTERAAAISFNFVMAIPPAIMFLFTLIPFLPITEQFQKGIFDLIRNVLPGEREKPELINFLTDFINKTRNGLLSFSFLLSMFFSSNAVMGIMHSFDKDYLGFRRRKGLQKRLVAFKITGILFVIVILSVLMFISRSYILELLGIENQLLINLIINLRWVIIVLLFFASISYIYRHAPAVDKKWRLINPGSILATLLMLLLTALFSWWVNNFGNYNEIYGSIGTIIIIMVLIFINSLVLLIGFELNVSISSLIKMSDERTDK